MALQGHTSIYVCMAFFLCMMSGLAGYGFVTKRKLAKLNSEAGLEQHFLGPKVILLAQISRLHT